MLVKNELWKTFPFWWKVCIAYCDNIFDKIDVKHYLWIMILNRFYSHLPDLQNLSAQIIVVTKWTEKK